MWIYSFQTESQAIRVRYELMDVRPTGIEKAFSHTLSKAL